MVRLLSGPGHSDTSTVTRDANSGDTGQNEGVAARCSEIKQASTIWHWAQLDQQSITTRSIWFLTGHLTLLVCILGLICDPLHSENSSLHPSTYYEGHRTSGPITKALGSLNTNVISSKSCT